jgi:hypothetical protein
MKRIGKVDIPQEAFLAVLRVGEDFFWAFPGEIHKIFHRDGPPAEAKAKAPIAGAFVSRELLLLSGPSVSR